MDPQGRTIGQYLRAKLGHESGFGGALIGLTESESSSPIVADVKGWSVAKVALESAVPIVGRVEPSVWELARLLKRLQAMRKDSTLNKSRPPMLEGAVGVLGWTQCVIRKGSPCLYLPIIVNVPVLLNGASGSCTLGVVLRQTHRGLSHYSCLLVCPCV